VTERFPPDDAAVNNDARSGNEDPCEPSVTQPSVPEPSVTEPSVTEPSVTAASVTAASNATPPASGPCDETSNEEAAHATVDTEFRFEQLDQRWIGLVRGIETMTWMVVGSAVLIVGLVGMLAGPRPLQAMIFAAWLLLSLLALFRIVWWPRLAYNHWSYRIGKKVFELRHGILWQVSVAIPLSRLQHIDLHRGPLERRRGLASVQLHTAGTKEASQLIPGLDLRVAQILRDQLIDAANRVPGRPPKSESGVNGTEIRLAVDRDAELVK
jgi:membrane protein YdbS with pleckstrin-like domain